MRAGSEEIGADARLTSDIVSAGGCQRCCMRRAILEGELEDIVVGGAGPVSTSLLADLVLRELTRGHYLGLGAYCGINNRGHSGDEPVQAQCDSGDARQ